MAKDVLKRKSNEAILESSIEDLQEEAWRVRGLTNWPNKPKHRKYLKKLNDRIDALNRVLQLLTQ
jgi:hypothetical protein